ncbi:MAG TPA: FMN-binding protein [Acidimicrobiales bacterium]|nr:FMN-binding protein [Acidimicrobiales bacterium]
MRYRAPFVLAASAAGLAGILSYHTHGTTLAVGSQSPAGGAGKRSAGSGAATTTPPATTAPDHTTPSSTAAANQTVTGPTVQYGYGQLAVRVTVSGGRITDVSVPVLQVAEYTSQYIAQQAIPMLKGQVLSAQSAKIQGVSGATYTSQAYDQSLQSALTRVK